MNRFSDGQREFLDAIARLRDLHLAEDLTGLPVDRVERLLSVLEPDLWPRPSGCEGTLARVRAPYPD